MASEAPEAGRRVKLRLEGVSVRYAGRPGAALEGVDLEVREGEVLAVVGPSGAGKSTLLRALNDLEPVASGRALLDGVPLEAIAPHEVRRRVGLVPQVPVSLADTVAGEVAFGPRLRGERGLDDPAAQAAALARVGLDPSFLPRPLARLSVGEQQRVCLARALANSPEVLLLDEPTSALDAGTAHGLLSLLAQLRAGLTVVLVTHALEHARALADRVALVQGGRVVDVAATARFFGPDASPAARAFVAPDGRPDPGRG